LALQVVVWCLPVALPPLVDELLLEVQLVLALMALESMWVEGVLLGDSDSE
jgi:hypothetical protein